MTSDRRTPLAALLLAALLLAPSAALAQDEPPTEPASPETTGAGIAPEPAEEGPAAPLGAVEAADPEQPPAPGAPGTEAGAEPAAEAEPAPEPEPDLAADFYLSRCAGCHTIGEGALTGPDLLPSTQWPAEDLAKAVERMEKNAGPMSDEEVRMLVELLQDQAVKQRLSAAREKQVAEMAATLEPPSPARGRELFHGAEGFRNRGVACAACHRAGGAGGTLSVDLTDAGERLGEQAVQSAAENPGFPLMKAAYGNRPVTRQEAVHVTAYLMELSEEDEAAAEPTPAPVGWWGAAVAGLFLLAMVVLYRGRVRGVRAPMVREATRR